MPSMHLKRGLARRILVLSAFVAIFHVVSLALTFGYLWVGNIIERVLKIRERHISDEHNKCIKSPSTWTIQTYRISAYAYDINTMRSMNPKADPPDPSLARRIRAGETIVSRTYIWGRHRGVLLRKLSDKGPCSLLQVKWHIISQDRQRIRTLLPLIALIATLLTISLSMFLLVQPLLKRLQALAQAAKLVGHEEGYVSASDNTPDEIGQVSAILDAAHQRICEDAEQLKRRQKALETHLANVAHDLRTPLASAHIAIEQELNQREKQDDKEHLLSALNDIVYLSALTDNLHLASQLADGADPLRGNPTTDLTQLVERSLLRFSLLGKRKGVEVAGAYPDSAVYITCNPTMAEQAINNVLQNAVIHNTEGGHVAIILSTPTEDTFCVEIVDDGPGVPPEVLPKLGDRTFRSDEARKRDPKGSGLGLAITSEVCLRAGFDLTFEAHEPQGLKVIITGNIHTS